MKQSFNFIVSIYTTLIIIYFYILGIYFYHDFCFPLINFNSQGHLYTAGNIRWYRCVLKSYKICIYNIYIWHRCAFIALWLQKWKHNLSINNSGNKLILGNFTGWHIPDYESCWYQHRWYQEYIAQYTYTDFPVKFESWLWLADMLLLIWRLVHCRQGFIQD